MSLNHLMHPRNIYKDNTPDFKDLSIKYAYFRSFARENKNGDVTIDFKNPEALRALLYALLENDMDLKIDIPLDRLIPTLPLRLNYIHWVEDLVKCLERDRDATILGIDIGTGTSCIYPLLGTKLNGWKFLATEVDEYSVRHAQHNIQQNGFTDNITERKVSWYSTMLGKKTSMKAVVDCLKEKQVPTVTTTRFCQGKTMRWGVAWSFLTGITVDIGPPSKRRKKETKSLSFNISKDSPALRCDGIHSRFERALKLMDDILMDLKIAIDERKLGDGVCRWQCSASEITWSNQRRKRREKKSGDNSKNSALETHMLPRK
ncbi:hypothetical protein QZH41_012029 [Actinostola sp. cb2023]|nr:hypothetical protein QZH41_012029 [Actinostola sp. cb2023]